MIPNQCPTGLGRGHYECPKPNARRQNRGRGAPGRPEAKRPKSDRAPLGSSGPRCAKPPKASWAPREMHSDPMQNTRGGLLFGWPDEATLDISMQRMRMARIAHECAGKERPPFMPDKAQPCYLCLRKGASAPDGRGKAPCHRNTSDKANEATSLTKRPGYQESLAMLTWPMTPGTH